MDVNNAFLHEALKRRGLYEVTRGVDNFYKQSLPFKKIYLWFKARILAMARETCRRTEIFSYTQSKNDYSLFVKKNKRLLLPLLLYTLIILLSQTTILLILPA